MDLYSSALSDYYQSSSYKLCFRYPSSAPSQLFIEENAFFRPILKF